MTNTTPWADQSKQRTAWASDTKTPTAFTPVDTPNPTRYTPNDTPVPGAWGPNFQDEQTYFYDDDMPYDSDFTRYDTLVNNNQDNQRLQTRWSAA